MCIVRGAVHETGVYIYYIASQNAGLATMVEGDRFLKSGQLISLLKNVARLYVSIQLICNPPS
jgi:hypothetical protein